METERIPEYLAANAARAVARLHALPVPPSFIFTTDFHAHDNSFVSAAVMKYLHAQTGVHRVFCGGDFAYAFGAPEDCVHDTERSLDYLETLKGIAEKCSDAADFKAEVEKQYPNYSGGNYLDMTAGFFFA